MNTIFWLAIVFGFLSLVVILNQATQYSKLSELEKMFAKPSYWPYPMFLACAVIALTI